MPLHREPQHTAAILMHLVEADPLTGLADRHQFNQQVQLEWRRAGRACNQLSLIMLDLDDFQEYNDSCGSLQGDNVLIEIARILESGLKSPAALAARYAGDRFVCLLPDASQESALKCAAKLHNAINELAVLPGSGRITASIGVATLRATPQNRAAQLVRQAGKKLYEAKTRGGNAIVAEEAQ